MLFCVCVWLDVEGLKGGGAKWVKSAENRPEILVKRIEGGHPRSQVYWEVLAQAGWTHLRIMAHCEELGVDPGIMQQM